MPRIFRESRRIDSARDHIHAPSPLELVTDAFVEKLRNGLHPAWLAHAATQYPVRERLSLITQQVLLMRPRDELWDATLRAREVLPKAREIKRRLRPDQRLQIDGGINHQTARAARDAGVDWFVVASAIFDQRDRKAAIAQIREQIR